MVGTTNKIDARGAKLRTVKKAAEERDNAFFVFQSIRKAFGGEEVSLPEVEPLMKGDE